MTNIHVNNNGIDHDRFVISRDSTNSKQDIQCRLLKCYVVIFYISFKISFRMFAITIFLLEASKISTKMIMLLLIMKLIYTLVNIV